MRLVAFLAGMAILTGTSGKVPVGIPLKSVGCAGGLSHYQQASSDD
jgi:hypothetical protein